MEIKINGEKPDLYSSERYDKFDQKVFVNLYRLVTGDSFEIGEAYSLHQTLEDARRYFFRRWWQKTSTPFPVFIEKKTLEKLIKTKDKTIFRSWES